MLCMVDNEQQNLYVNLTLWVFLSNTVSQDTVQGFHGSMQVATKSNGIFWLVLSVNLLSPNNNLAKLFELMLLAYFNLIFKLCITGMKMDKIQYVSHSICT
jgi:hypothetical protein